MATIDERLVSKVVSEVLARLQTQTQTQTKVASLGPSGFGVYEDMAAACEAAHRSFEKLRELGVSARRKAIQVIRKMCVAKAQEWGSIEFAETDRKSTRLNSSHPQQSRMPSSA